MRQEELKQRLQHRARDIMQKYSTLIDKRKQLRQRRMQSRVQNRKPILRPRILIVDGTNCYLRRFSVHQRRPTVEGQKSPYTGPQLTNRNGQQTGAVYTMVLMLNKMCQTLKATHRFICWEGYNSKRNRLKVNENYKADRVYKKSSSFVPQLKRVQSYIGYLPMLQMKVDYAEADDLIGLLAKQYPEYQKIIVSQDQDFVQLVDPKTKVFFPMKKTLLDERAVVRKYNCLPCNFVYYKSILGDASDNIQGIRGIGPKTLQKRFSFLKTVKINDIDHLISLVEDQKIKSKVIQMKQTLKNNIKIMDLNDNLSMLSLQSIQNFKSQLTKPVSLDNANLRILMAYDGIYGKTIQKIVKSMHIMQYLRKKWDINKKETNNEPIGNRETRTQRRGRSPDKGEASIERIADDVLQRAPKDQAKE